MLDFHPWGEGPEDLPIFFFFKKKSGSRLGLLDEIYPN